MSLTTADLLNDRPYLQKITAMLPNIVSLTLVVALGYTLAQFGWQIFSPDDQDSQSIAPVTRSTSSTRPVQNLGGITRSHLFGKESRGTGKPAQVKTPVSKLNVTLRGVLAAEPDTYSTAIISAGKGKTGKEEIYGIGDKIQNGVKLVEIHPDHVIIERQGKYEKLLLTKTKSSGPSAAPVRNTARKGSIKSGNLGDIRREIMKNPTSFGEYALPVVVKQKGKQIGYRLKPQKKGELLSQYGLQSSDIITEINGVSLNNPQNGIKALRELSSASSVNLTVKRGNSFVPISITLQ